MLHSVNVANVSEKSAKLKREGGFLEKGQIYRGWCVISANAV